MNTSTFDWSCRHTWKTSAKNTMWCVIGCSIGDFGTIFFFQLSKISFPILGIMTLAIINGLITSIILETFILIKQNFKFKNAFLNLKFCFIKINVSKIILVIKPLMIAKVIIPKIGNEIFDN